MSQLTRPIAIPSVVRMTVTLYTRPHCCCCQTAREVLRDIQEAHGFDFEELDASDPALFGSIGLTVPAIAVDGKVRFRGEVNRVLFERLISSREPT